MKAFIRGALEAEAQSQLQQVQMNQAMAQGMSQVFSRMIHSHQDDGVGVIFDVVGIALSIALIPTGLGVLGLVGFVGSAVLLGTDSYAYALEMSDKDQAAEEFKKNTERYRIIATVMTLPDIAYGGYKAVRELVELRELAAMDRATSTSATAIASRTNNAARAERFHQIAERANLRAQIRTEQIRAALKLEITPRATGAASAALLVREEIQNDESLLHQFLRFLQVHSTVVHAT